MVRCGPTRWPCRRRSVLIASAVSRTVGSHGRAWRRRAPPRAVQRGQRHGFHEADIDLAGSHAWQSMTWHQRTACTDDGNFRAPDRLSLHSRDRPRSELMAATRLSPGGLGSWKFLNRVWVVWRPTFGGLPSLCGEGGESRLSAVVVPPPLTPPRKGRNLSYACGRFSMAGISAVGSVEAAAFMFLAWCPACRTPRFASGLPSMTRDRRRRRFQAAGLIGLPRLGADQVAARMISIGFCTSSG
jgi:hypothetical protein